MPARYKNPNPPPARSPQPPPPAAREPTPASAHHPPARAPSPLICAMSAALSFANMPPAVAYARDPERGADPYLDAILQPETAEAVSPPDALPELGAQGKRASTQGSAIFANADTVAGGMVFCIRLGHPLTPVFQARRVLVPGTTTYALGVVAQYNSANQLPNFATALVVGAKIAISPSALPAGGGGGGTVEALQLPPHQGWGDFDPNSASLLPPPWWSAPTLAMKGAAARLLPYVASTGAWLNGNSAIPRNSAIYPLAVGVTNAYQASTAGTSVTSTFVAGQNATGRVRINVLFDAINTTASAANIVLVITPQVLDGSGAYVAAYGAVSVTVNLSVGANSLGSQSITLFQHMTWPIAAINVVVSAGPGAGVTWRFSPNGLHMLSDYADSGLNNNALIIFRGIAETVPIQFNMVQLMACSPRLALLAEMSAEPLVACHTDSRDLVAALMSNGHLSPVGPLPDMVEQEQTLRGMPIGGLVARAGVGSWLRRRLGNVRDAIGAAPGLINRVRDGVDTAGRVAAHLAPLAALAAMPEGDDGEVRERRRRRGASLFPGRAARAAQAGPLLFVPLSNLDCTAPGLLWEGVVSISRDGTMLTGLVWDHPPAAWGYAHDFSAPVTLQTVAPPVLAMELPSVAAAAPPPRPLSPRLAHRPGTAIASPQPVGPPGPLARTAFERPGSADWQDLAGPRPARAAGGAVLDVAELSRHLLRGQYVGQGWSAARFPVEVETRAGREDMGGAICYYVTSSRPLGGSDPRFHFSYRPAHHPGFAPVQVSHTIVGTAADAASVAYAMGREREYQTAFNPQRGIALPVAETSYLLAEAAAAMAAPGLGPGFVFSGSLDASGNVVAVACYSEKSQAAAAIGAHLAGSFQGVSGTSLAAWEATGTVQHYLRLDNLGDLRRLAALLAGRAGACEARAAVPTQRPPAGWRPAPVSSPPNLQGTQVRYRSVIPPQTYARARPPPPNLPLPTTAVRSQRGVDFLGPEGAGMMVARAGMRVTVRETGRRPRPGKRGQGRTQAPGAAATPTAARGGPKAGAAGQSGAPNPQPPQPGAAGPVTAKAATGSRSRRSASRAH